LMLGGFAAVMIIASLVGGNFVIGLFLALPALLYAYIFGYLKIVLNRDQLIWSFKFGLFERRLHIAEMTSAEIFWIPQYMWPFGLGVLPMFPGWLYSVGDPRTIKITRKFDSPVYLSVKEPKRLAALLKSRMDA